MSETTEVQHTPGPWVTQPDQLGRDGARWWVHDGDYGDIALVLAPLVREDWVAEEAAANARAEGRATPAPQGATTEE